MSKHIIDGPRSRVTSDRLEQYTRIDAKTSGRPSRQTEQLSRENRVRSPGLKLRRFTDLDRQS